MRVRCGEREEPRCDGVRQEHLDVRPAPRGEPADHPHQGTVNPVTVEDHHRRDARTEKGGHGNAREDDARRTDAVPPRKDVDEERGEHRPAECGGGDEPRRARQHEHDKNARKTRTGRDADNVRVGERISEDRLQDRP